MTSSLPPIKRTYRVYVCIPWGAEKEYKRFETVTVDAVDEAAAAYVARDRYELFARVHNSEVQCRVEVLPRAAW